LPGLTLNPGKTHSRLRVDPITQPWLRVLVKRWSRLRLSSGMAIGTVAADVKALTRLSQFLTAAAPEVDALDGVDRALLERYLAWLATAGLGHGAREDAVTCLGMFFQALRQHDWDSSLPTTAIFFAADLPPRPSRLTRHLSEHVMAQVESPVHLDRWPNPEGRLVTLIPIQCGLRATDACTLAFDCLLHDGQGAPYLRYFNNKMRREAAVPIDADLEAEIRTQQRRVVARWPQNHPHLFVHLKGNAGGQRPLSYSSYPRDAQLLAGAVSGPRRARPPGSPHPPPVAPQLRLPTDQPRRLPHGYCGLPVQKSCPHANACLTCPVFLTGPEFLPELREHHARTLTLIDNANANGHTRVAQMNTDVLTNLDKMIGEIDEQQAGTGADAGGQLPPPDRSCTRASRTDPHPRTARPPPPRQRRRRDHLRGHRPRGQRLPVLALQPSRPTSRDPSPTTTKPSLILAGDSPATARQRHIPPTTPGSRHHTAAPARGRQPNTYERGSPRPSARRAQPASSANPRAPTRPADKPSNPSAQAD